MTVRRITSSVSCDIRGATANSLPTGHDAMFSAASRPSPRCRATASRLERCNTSLRRSRRTSPSMTSTELDPSSLASIELASPAWNIAESPAKTALMSAGSSTYTSVPIPEIRNVNTLP